VDKIGKYTGEQFSDFEILEQQRDGHRLAEIRIGAVAVPMVVIQPELMS